MGKNQDLKIYAKELHKPVIKNFNRRKVVSLFNNYIWAADLAFIKTPNTTKDNKPIYQILLNIIDLYSRYAWSIRLKTKSGDDILKAFQTLTKKLDTTPYKLWVDKGSEFFNKPFMKW
jgi:transposase InsO family protein